MKGVGLTWTPPGVQLPFLGPSSETWTQARIGYQEARAYASGSIVDLRSWPLLPQTEAGAKQVR